MSSLGGSALLRRQRARSTVHGNYSQTTATHTVQGFGASSSRFALSPHQFKAGEKGHPSPSNYNVRSDLFKNELEKGKGASFGLGRSNMQLVDQDRDVRYLKGNPSPHKYSPNKPGIELAKDSSKYTFQSKAHSIGFIEKKRNQDKPGPGKYMPRSNLDYFSNEIRFNNKFPNPKTSSFGGEKRFSFPT